MPGETSITELEKELQQERALRVAAEEQARKWKAELVALENEMSKAQRLRERVDRYKYKLNDARRRKNIYGAICIAAVLLLGIVLLDRFRKAREMETLKNEFRQSGAPKRNLPGIITQEAMERDAERQGGKPEDAGDE